ncbi:hypothetical protein LIA77_09119 [Sarocladium implicatum]|nr:hypothetical protein LIA77_09119 [Sarocladium implicatum]
MLPIFSMTRSCLSSGLFDTSSSRMMISGSRKTPVSDFLRVARPSHNCRYKIIDSSTPFDDWSVYSSP